VKPEAPLAPGVGLEPAPGASRFRKIDHDANAEECTLGKLPSSSLAQGSRTRLILPIQGRSRHGGCDEPEPGLAKRTGLEPVPHSLEGCCSIHLS
jgi:hypothetical protein